MVTVHEIKSNKEHGENDKFFRENKERNRSVTYGFKKQQKAWKFVTIATIFTRSDNKKVIYTPFYLYCYIIILYFWNVENTTKQNKQRILMNFTLYNDFLYYFC